MIRRVLGIYFSPIGGTAEMTRSLAAGLAANLDACSPLGIKYETCDLLSLPEAGIELDDETVAVIGFPVYIGKVPLPALRALCRVKPNGALSITVVSYGARTFGNALYELRHSAEELGFKIIGAGAFAVKYTSPRKRQGGTVLNSVDTEALSTFCNAVTSKIKRIAGCTVETMRIRPAPLEVSGKIPVHRISRISPRAAMIAEGVLQRLNIPHRRSEWFL